MFTLKQKRNIKRHYSMQPSKVAQSAGKAQLSHQRNFATSEETRIRDTWVLNENPDAKQLNAFWERVLHEARKDPQWIFVNED